LLHEPRLAESVAQLGSNVRFHSALPADVRETVILAVAAELNGEYFWETHAPLGKAAGLSDEIVQAIRSRKDLDGPAGCLVSYARAVLSSRAADRRIFDALLRRFEPSGMVALTVTIGYYGMLCSLLSAFEVSAPA
jgi:4-carboxymuconolactone decarboxylase